MALGWACGLCMLLGRLSAPRRPLRWLAWSLPLSFPRAKPSARIVYFVDELTVTPRATFVGGWAAIPNVLSRRGALHVVLRSERETHIFTTIAAQRPDVAAAYHEPSWRLCGFLFAVRRDRLPTGEFHLGFLIDHGRDADLIMTDHRLRLIGEGQAFLATTE